MDTSTAKRLVELELYFGRYGSDDVDATNFWDGFYSIAGRVDALAFAGDPGPDVRERYIACLGGADERGFTGPSEPKKKASE